MTFIASEAKKTQQIQEKQKQARNSRIVKAMPQTTDVSWVTKPLYMVSDTVPWKAHFIPILF